MIEGELESQDDIESYARLVARFPLDPIRNDEELDRAAAIIDELIARDLDPGEDDYLDALSDLVLVREDVHYPISCPPDGPPEES